MGFEVLGPRATGLIFASHCYLEVSCNVSVYTKTSTLTEVTGVEELWDYLQLLDVFMESSEVMNCFQDVRQEQQINEAQKDQDCSQHDIPLLDHLPESNGLLPQQSPQVKPILTQPQWQYTGSPRLTMDPRRDIKAEMERKMDEDMKHKDLSNMSIIHGALPQPSLSTPGVSSNSGTGVSGMSMGPIPDMGPPLGAMPVTGGGAVHLDQVNILVSFQLSMVWLFILCFKSFVDLS